MSAPTVLQRGFAPGSEGTEPDRRPDDEDGLDKPWTPTGPPRKLFFASS